MVNPESKPNRQAGRPVQWLTLIIFIVFIMLLAGLTFFAGGRGLFAGLRDSWQEAGADGAISRLETNFNEGFYAKRSFIEVNGLVQRAAGVDFVKDTDYSYSVVRDNHDELHFISYELKMQEAAQRIAEFKELAPCFYIQTPVKDIPGYTELPPTIEDKSNESADAVLAWMAEQNVPALDLRAAATALPPESLFYRTDHHWRVETAFWAVGQTVQALRDVYGLELDPTGFYTDPANYEQTYYPDFFLGSQGRRVGRLYAGLDDFTLITPDFPTDYTLLRSGTEKTGSFTEALCDWGMMTTEGNSMYSKAFNVYNNRYAVYFGGDFDKLTVVNHLQQDAPRVLLIKDSFSLPYAAFLSTMCSELTLIDLRYYDIEQLAAYISGSDFDLVLLMFK